MSYIQLKGQFPTKWHVGELFAPSIYNILLAAK